jgi:hypothetical protein
MAVPTTPAPFARVAANARLPGELLEILDIARLKLRGLHAQALI